VVDPAAAALVAVGATLPFGPVVGAEIAPDDVAVVAVLVTAFDPEHEVKTMVVITADPAILRTRKVVMISPW
jgi:hypothetical protein